MSRRSLGGFGGLGVFSWQYIYALAAWLPCIALAGRDSVGRALCGTNLRDNATPWGIYVAQLGDRRQDRTIR